MRELHVVAVSEDGRHVLLAGTKGASTGGFRVALDDRLLAAVRGDLAKPGEDPHAPSDLTPKDIQARLRTGESAESIALSAGVPVTRVERFSGPVQGEMARMIDATRSAYLVRGRLGRSTLTLGQAVDRVLAQTPSLRPESITWETRREDDGRWLVTVSWFARARTRSAAWHYDPATKTVTGTDPAAAALAHHDPDTSVPNPKRRTAKATAPAPRVPARKAAAKAAPKATAKKVGAKKATAKKPAAPKPAAKPAAKKVSAKASASRPTAKKPAAPKPAAKKVAAPTRKVAAKVPAKAARVLRVVPDPEPRRVRKPKVDTDGVTTRATVPGWADVLLGTSPGGDR